MQSGLLIQLWRFIASLLLVSFAAGSVAPPFPYFDLPAGDAAATLPLFAEQSGRQIMFPAQSVAGVQTMAVTGRIVPRDALSRMVTGTPLTVVEDAQTGAFMVYRSTTFSTDNASLHAGSVEPAGSEPPPNPPHQTMIRRTPLAVIGAFFGSALAAVQSLSAQEVPAATPPPSEPEVILMSPFEVGESTNDSYRATRTLSGTRINTNLEDLAASISVVTKQQLLDNASIDINDIFLHEGSTEGTHQFTDYELVPASGNSGEVFVDRTGNQPAQANRIRGLGSANVSVGGFETTGGVPIDTYNVDQIEISRGPNSNIFGLGGAAGTVNLLPSQANLSRRVVRATVRADSYGGWRVEGDYNVPLIPNRLALRVLGMYEDKGFTRDPSYDKTRRQTLSATFQPFSKTTIRASFENYDNRSSLPNSMTPRDHVSKWIDAGQIVWNPLTGTLTRRSDGAVLTTNAVFNNRNTQVFVPEYGLGTFSGAFNRVNQYIDGGGMALFTVPRMVGATSGIPGPLNSQVNTSGFYVNSRDLQDPIYDILWRPSGISDPALYDYENLSYSGPNFSLRDSTEVRASFDQELLRTETHHLAIQLGYFKQKVRGRDRNLLGGSGGIPTDLMIDVNEKLLDGSDNPFFLRPYMGGSEPTKRWIIDDSEIMRGQVAYILDLTHKDNWLRWLGRNSFVGYGEHRDRISASLGFRDYVTSVHSWKPEFNSSGAVNSKVSSGFRQTVRYYMGDDAGYNIDYAPEGFSGVGGQHNLYWYNGNTQAWITEPVVFEELHDAGRLRSESRYTHGLVWQTSLLNDMIVPTVGYREDRLREYESPSRIIGPDGYPDLSPMWNLHDPNINYAKSYTSGETRTAGVVLKPLRWLRVHYNQSDSFRPGGIAYNIWGDIVANASGEGKDYGFTLLLADDKISIRYNQYETVELNSRTGGGSATMLSRLQRIDHNINRDQLPEQTDSFNLEATAYRWVLANHRVVDKTLLTEEEREAYRREAWETYIEPTGLPFSYRDLRHGEGAGQRSYTDTNRATARGREIEISYNPNRYFTLKTSITQTRAFDDGVAEGNIRWIEARLPEWEAVVVPANLMRYDALSQTWQPDPRAGQNWWTTADPGVTNQIPQAWYQGNVESTYAMLTAQAGKAKPQIREWRVSTTLRYDLAGITTQRHLRNMSVGGSLRWADKAAIGYLAEEPAAGLPYVRFDTNKPVFDDGETQVDLMVNYRVRIMSDRVMCRLQLNVRNVFESGGLRVVGVNPDGVARDFRIIDPRQATFTASFEF